MRANSVPGGTIREGALFFQTVAAAGALFKRGHYSREYGKHKDKSTETVTGRLGSERSPMTILPVVDGGKHPP